LQNDGDSHDENGITLKLNTEGVVRDSIQNYLGNASSVSFYDKLNGIASLLGNGTYDLMLTEDGGTSWQYKKSVCIDSLRNSYLSIRYLKYISKDTILANCYASGMCQELFTRSYDGGISWSSNDVDSLWATCGCVFIDGKTGFACGIKYGIFEDSAGVLDPNYNTTPVIKKTTDGGVSWEKVYSNDSISAQVVSMSAIGNNIIAVAAKKAIYKSSDMGHTWVTNSIINSDIFLLNDACALTGSCVIMMNSDNYMFKWSEEYNPVFENSPVTTPVSACPTPFTESTVVKYTLETAGAVMIRVMNSMGEKVTEREFFAQAGEREFSISGVDLPAGVYFCDIITNGKTYRAKTVLVR
jgi:hypothetical protein